MGKGDLRTKKGKRCRGTFGKTRPKNKPNKKKTAPAKAATTRKRS